MIADFTIDQPALLENNRKIAMMGGGDYHRVKKMASLCSWTVCFFGCFRSSKKLGLPPKKIILAGAPELDPLQETTFSNQTGQFPIRSLHGNKYIMVMVEIDSNAILVEPMKNCKDDKMIRAYNALLL